MKKALLSLIASIMLLSGCESAEKPIVSTPLIETSPSTVETSHAPVTDGTYQVEEHSLKTDEGTIYGEMYLPGDGTEVYPTVILAHGIGGNHKDLELFASWFAKEGCCAYVFDFIGGGYDIKSSGTLLDMSVLTEERDLEHVINDICSLSYVDEERLFLLGQSQGGYICSLTASRNPEKVRGIMLLYPAFALQHFVREKYGSGQAIPETDDIFSVTVSRKYFEDALSVDIYKEIENYDGDVLAFQGDSDTIAPIEYTEEAMQHFQHGRLEIIHGADHGFVLSISEEIQKEFHSFVEKHWLNRNIQEIA